MPEIKLKIADLVLDNDNPRITHSDGQQEALQKIIKDQKTKLVKLAESIAEHGLNPMDRLLVLRVNSKPERFIAIEGNRRVAVFKLLTNPAVMSGLDIPAPMKRAFERLSATFKKSEVEPLPCFELSSREDGRYWLNLRHNIGHDGASVDNWKTLAKRRFEGKPPSVQVLELVEERAGLTASEQASITDRFPTSTLERLLENRAVRQELGLDFAAGKLTTKLPANEIAKPLKKIVLDLATKRVQVGKLMKTDNMLAYVGGLGADHLPDLSKAQGKVRSLDEIPVSEFSKIKRARRKPDPSDRKELVPKGCPVNVTDNRIAEIYKELRTLKVADSRNAISVLIRVFLELSVDHFLETNGVNLHLPVDPKSGKKAWKKLDKKLAETVDILIRLGVPAAHFAPVTRSVSDKNSPMHTDLFHRYVHDRFQTPVTTDLIAAWNNAQPLFEKIWP
ncbi:MAG: hypothetical protein E5Y12_20160 [Mesorhizobium sp.]|nr:MAG: hypothetical protein E5Y12_20160 [Mesorhizobium sp.]